VFTLLDASTLAYNIILALVFLLLLAAGGLFLLLLVYKAWARLCARWRRWRTGVYQPIFHRFMEGVPGDYVDLFKPRRQMDFPIVEELLIAVISRFKGSLSREAIQIGEKLYFPQKRLNDLKHTKNVYKLAALIEKLGLYGSGTAIPPLMECLVHASSDIRFVAARALSRIGDPIALPSVLKLVRAEPLSATGRYVDVFLRFGAAAIPFLYALLNDREPLRRWTAVTSLGEIRDSSTAGRVGPLLQNDPDTSVREAAAKALAQTGATEWVPVLMEALDDPNEAVRVNAAAALGRMPDTQALPVLEKALDDRSWPVRFESAKSLALLGEAGKTILRRRLLDTEEDMRVLIENLLPR
jgi:hypothetical protein